MVGVVKPKKLKAKGHFGEMACSYISKYIFTYMFCQRPKLRMGFGFLVICGELIGLLFG